MPENDRPDNTAFAAKVLRKHQRLEGIKTRPQSPAQPSAVTGWMIAPRGRHSGAQQRPSRVSQSWQQTHPYYPPAD
jgi:hypothetical protein